MFNEFFNEVPEKLILDADLKDVSDRLNSVTSVTESNVPSDTRRLGREEHTHYLDCFQLTESDVERAINSLKTSWTKTGDGLSPQFSKSISKLLSRILTPLFNKSLRDGVFPDILKFAILIPILKGGLKTQISNYRPIARLLTISKIFEKCVKEKITNYLDYIQFFLGNQYGFIKNKSTDLALFRHITDITEGIERNNFSAAVYLDLAKAFDTVNHKLLIQKLKTIGIRGPLLDWFTSYLTDREHSVRINNTISPKLKMKHGVPQGSVLGPLLFNIYINNLFCMPLKAKIVGYADDTSLQYSKPSAEEINEDFKHDQEIITKWFQNHLLHLNINKCKGIVYSFKETEKGKNINFKLGDIVHLNW